MNSYICLSVVPVLWHRKKYTTTVSTIPLKTKRIVSKKFCADLKHDVDVRISINYAIYCALWKIDRKH